jgi:enoyl-[acyl-carrier protein] reductase II
MKNYEKIEKLMDRGCRILGSKYAILGGAMTWISESNLVSAMSNEGIFGILASGAMNGDILRNELTLTQQKTSNNFGVNIILVNPELHNLIDVCGEKKVSHIILAGGIPDREILEKIHGYGIQVFSFAQSLAIAKRLFKNGVDAIILEGNEAGGHVCPVSTMILIQDILLNLNEYPIFVAGGIIRGEVFASILMMGAVGCQMGSVFACAKESTAHENFKKAFFRASGRNAATTMQLDKKFPVSLVRALENSGTDEFIKKQKEVIEKFENKEVSLEEGRLILEKFHAGALRRAVQEGDTEHGSLMAGQIVQIIYEEKSIAEIVEKILSESENYLSKLKNLV